MTWNEELEDKYYRFFDVYEGEETERSYYKKGQILRGIECSEGWKKPVEQFLKTLEWIEDNYDYVNNPKFGIEEDEHIKIKGNKPVIKIFQIKEKFGECRCYVTGNQNSQGAIDRAVAKLDAICSVTCERCGKLEEDCIRRSNGWIICVCKECFDNLVLSRG